MASVKSKKHTAKKIRKKSGLRIRAGKLGTYQAAVDISVKDARAFRKLINETLSQYGTILDDIPDISILGPDGAKLVEICTNIHDDGKDFDEKINPLYDDAASFMKSTSANAMGMHFASLGIINSIKDTVDAHTRLYKLSLDAINLLKL